MAAQAVRAGTRTWLLAALVAAVAALGFTFTPATPQVLGTHLELQVEPAEGETVTAAPAGSELIAVKQWTPGSDYVLMCDNYEGLLPMRKADLFVTFTAPPSGTVVVSASAMSAQSEPDLYEYWGLMLGDEVVAEGMVGYGDQRHRVTARFVVDQLEPGEMVRLDLAHRSDHGGQANLYLGPTYGPAVLEVWSA